MAIERESLAVTITVDSKDAKASLKAIEKELKSLTKTLEKVDMGQLEGDLKAVEEANEKTAQAMSSTSDSADGLSGSLEKLGQAAKTALKAFVGFQSVKIARNISPQLRVMTDIMGKDMVRSAKMATASVGSLAGSLTGVGSEASKFFKVFTITGIPGIVGATAELTLLGTVLGVFGSQLQNSENATVRFAGKISILTGLILGGFGFAITAALTAIGALIQKISLGLFQALDELSLKFEKGREGLAQFNFTIKNFGKQLGTEAVGSLATWNKFVDDSADKTTASVKEIQKSIGLLVKESQILGFTVPQNQELLARAFDLSAQTGKDLNDVVNSLVSAFNGNSQAVLSLGIDLSQSALDHTHVAHAAGLHAKELDDASLKQLRFASFLEQTEPLLGASALALNSLSGSQARFNTQLDTLTQRIGGSATVLITWNQVMTKALQIVNMIPQPVFEFIGALLQVGSILGIVIGTILKWIFLINTVITVYLILNTLLITNTSVSAAATAAMSALGVSVGANIVPVTSLSAAFANLNRIMIAGIGPAIAKIGSMFLGLATSIAVAAKAALAFLASLIPLIAKVLAAVAVVAAFAQAIREVIEETPELQQAIAGLVSFFSGLITTITGTKEGMDTLAGSMVGTKVDVLDLVKNGLMRLFSVLVDIAKLVVNSVVANFKLMQIGFIELKKMFADDDEIVGYNNQLKQLNEELEAVQERAMKSVQGIMDFGDAARIARLEAEALAAVDLFTETTFEDDPGASSAPKLTKKTGGRGERSC